MTALDASSETLALNAAKHGTDRVEHLQADLFAFVPPRRFDVVFFSFWISHIPPDRWPGFWAMVGDSLAPGGRVFFLDGARPAHAIANGPHGWRDSKLAEGAERLLRDGRRFHVVKRYWEPQVLRADLASLGWRASVRESSWAFMYGEATRS